ncbi:hypothetical protein ACWDWS_02500 [Streptomyces sp. NPDC003328]
MLIDLTTDRVIMLKPVRRKAFDQGKSKALTGSEVVQMTDGTVWHVSHRRPEFWAHRANAPLTVAFQLSMLTFREAVEFVRTAEASYITAEHPTVKA